MESTSKASKKSIPRFSSFRPKEPSPPVGKHGYSLTYGPTHEESPVRVRYSQNNHSEDEEQGRSKNRPKADGTQPTSTDFIISSYDETEPHDDVFRSDRTGDPKNLIFGALDRYAIPIYSRIGAGNIIGSGSALKIDRAISNEKGLVLVPQGIKERHGKKLLLNVDRETVREVRVRKEAESEDVWTQAADYIPLRSVLHTEKKRYRNDATASPESTEDERMPFDSLSWKPESSTKWSDPDLDYIGDAGPKLGARPAVLDESLQLKRLESIRRLDSEPHNVEAWLQLVHYQDESLGPQPTKAEQRSAADIKMSLYEKALHAVKGVESRQKLLVRMMEEAPNIWDSQKLSTKWNQVLKSNPGFHDLWIDYLDFKQTAFHSFSYEIVQNVFLDCIQILQDSIVLRANDSPGHENIHENHTLVMLRMTLFMRESGFLEHAIAAWQALLEYDFFEPSTFSHNHDQAEDSAQQNGFSDFKLFWESEVCRIGEEGAKGWASSLESRSAPPAQEKRSIDHVAPQGGGVCSTWIIMERAKALQSRQPARVIEDVTGTDPYSTILFSDIRAFLPFPSRIHSRTVLLDAFLIFCQLPIYGEGRIGTRWYQNGFFRSEALYVDPKNFLFNRVADLPRSPDLNNKLSQRILQEHAPFDVVHSDLHIDLEILFAKTGSWFSAFNSWRKIHTTSQSPIEPTWVLNALKSLLTSDVADEQLAEYVLALELYLSPDTATKTAKNLLKKRTSSLRLYNAYAMIEFRLGHIDKAENVLIAAINMSRDLGNVANHDSILLWRTWIWQLVSGGEIDEAFSRLQTYGDSAVKSMTQSSSGENPPNHTKTLRTESGLGAFRERMIFLRLPGHAVLAMECLILFEYLKTPSNLSAATVSFTANLDTLSKNFPGVESSEVSLRQSFARLLYHHATHEHLFKPSDNRAFLAESIARFPQNTIFLSLYAWNETRFRIDDRVRSIVQDVVLGTNDVNKSAKENVVSHFHAIQIEINRGVGFGSNDNTIRATFERAIQSRSGRHCAGIWKMYFLFEHARQDLKKATSVFYRAIKACPWVKEIYLLPFEYLQNGPGSMREVDLKAVYDLMVERELRVHVDLEELIEQRTG